MEIQHTMNGYDQTLGDSQGSDAALIADRFGLSVDNIKKDYIKPTEQLTGFGSGGSESLVMFLKCSDRGEMVRKVCAETLASVPWDPDGTGVMTPPSTKGGLQAEYLQSLPEAARPYFPALHDVQVEYERGMSGEVQRKLIVDQSLLEGKEMSAYIAETKPRLDVVKHLHRTVMQLLADKIHPHRETCHTGESIGSSHLDKIEARLELSRATTPQLFGQLLDSERIFINGKEYLNIDSLLEFFRQPHVIDMLEPRVMSLVMGDTNTENVMVTKVDELSAAIEQQELDFTYDDIGLKFIDPRAIGHNSSGASTKDDRMYDNKPPHNTLGNYDIVHGEYFDLSLGRKKRIPSVSLESHRDNPYSKSYKDIHTSDYFSYVMDGWGVNDPEFQYNDPNWLLRFTFMMGSHFAAMPPFHFKKSEDGSVLEDFEMQKRAIAIYCEGIKWLNHAHDMIEGDLRSLYGVSLSPIAANNRH